MMMIRMLLMVMLVTGVLSACRFPSAGGPADSPGASVKLAGGSLKIGPQLTSSGTQLRVAGGSYTNITPAELHQMLGHKDVLLINTHVPYEGELAATDSFVPFDQTAQRLAAYPRDKTAKIVVYCRSGRMSAIAAATLVGAGYTNVWNLDRGMQGWEAAGYAVLHR